MTDAYRGPWVMHMTWLDLAFFHWPVRVEQLRPLIPPQLAIDTFDGWAWVGVVPFRMRNVRARLTPALPWFSAFMELNVRTYVTGDRPGVWFFSLDAENPFAVRTARQLFHLPYMDARMAMRKQGELVRYGSRRTHRGEPPADLLCDYWPTGERFKAAPGSFDEFLVERYCLYAADPRRHVWRCDIRHHPWTLRPADSDLLVNTMGQQIGLDFSGRAPVQHYTDPLDVLAWAPRRIG